MDTKGKDQQGILSSHRYKNLDKRSNAPLLMVSFFHIKLWILKKKVAKKKCYNNSNNVKITEGKSKGLDRFRTFE